MGKCVLTAVANVNDKLAPTLLGLDVTDQSGIDALMNEIDGTDNKGTVRMPMRTCTCTCI